MIRNYINQDSAKAFAESSKNKRQSAFLLGILLAWHGLFKKAITSLAKTLKFWRRKPALEQGKAGSLRNHVNDIQTIIDYASSKDLQISKE